MDAVGAVTSTEYPSVSVAVAELPAASDVVTEASISVPAFFLTFLEKQLIGSTFGSANIRKDIPALLELYTQGQLDLDGTAANEKQKMVLLAQLKDVAAGSEIGHLHVRHQFIEGLLRQFFERPEPFELIADFKKFDFHGERPCEPETG